MATIRDIVTRASRKLAVGGVGVDLEEEEILEGVATINTMVWSWKLKSIDLAWTEKAADDTFPLADEYQEGIIYLLAGRLSPDYREPASFDADAWFRNIQNANPVTAKATIPSGLTTMPSQTTNSVPVQ